MKYNINSGPRDHAIRLGCEAGLYSFIKDYSEEMGYSMSGGLRRLALIGARCEAEHGKARMPASYAGLQTGPKELNQDTMEKFKHNEEFEVDF